MDQLALAFAQPDIGHNQPPEPIDPIAALNARLATSHADLVTRFRHLELTCLRVPDPIDNDEDATTATDFIAQCQQHIKTAEAAHKREKELFLKAGRVVDGFFKRRCEQLSQALASPIARLKSYRDRIAEAERQRHDEERHRAEAELKVAADEAAAHWAEAERLARESLNDENRARAVDQVRLAEDASSRATAAHRQASLTLEPTHLRGDYGAIAYVRRNWTFEVVDLDRVPREYMSLDTEVVRQAINRDKIRTIPGLRIFQAESLRVRGAA